MGSGVVFGPVCGEAAAAGTAGTVPCDSAVLPGCVGLRLVGSGRRGQVADTCRSVRWRGPAGRAGAGHRRRGPGRRHRPARWWRGVVRRLCPEPARPPPAPRRRRSASGSSLRSSCRPASGAVGAGCRTRGGRLGRTRRRSLRPVERLPRPGLRCRRAVVGALGRVRIWAGPSRREHRSPRVRPGHRSPRAPPAGRSSPRCAGRRPRRGALQLRQMSCRPGGGALVSGVARVGPLRRRPAGRTRCRRRRAHRCRPPAAAVIGTASVGAAAWSTSASALDVGAGGHVVRVVVPVGRSGRSLSLLGRCSPASGATVASASDPGPPVAACLVGGPALRLPRLRAKPRFSAEPGAGRAGR